MAGSIRSIVTKAFVVWFLLGSRPLWGMLKGKPLAGVCPVGRAKGFAEVWALGLCWLTAVHLRRCLLAEGSIDCFLITDCYVVWALLGPLL